MGIKICPTCRSEDITYVSGGLNGLWKCKGCGYENDIFPERDEINKPEDKDNGK